MERDEVYWLRGTITRLEAQVDGLQYELRVREIRLKEKDRRIAELEQQVEELKKQATAAAAAPAKVLPAFVKLNVARRRRKMPGRSVGHEAALRPMPPRIDHHQDVPLATDRSQRPLCPQCRCPLTVGGAGRCTL
ncbi:MAG TPA: hypothetical protein VGR35_19940 [Tepidisphaeraceae bacterium]|nr:hypothetical protein [Tepidisphaeraceae bacterium]